MIELTTEAIAYLTGLAAEFLVWIIGLIWLYREKGYAGIMQNFAVISILFFALYAVIKFMTMLPSSVGGPILVGPTLGSFEHGVYHGFIVTTFLNLVAATIAVAIIKARRK